MVIGILFFLLWRMLCGMEYLVRGVEGGCASVFVHLYAALFVWRRANRVQGVQGLGWCRCWRRLHVEQHVDVVFLEGWRESL